MRIVNLLIFLFIVKSVCSQDCNHFIEKTYDEVTGTTFLRMKDYLFISANDENKVAIFIAERIDEDGIETSLTIDCKDLGCISNGNPINILFTDGSRVQYQNVSEQNCVGFAMLFISIPDFDGISIKSLLMKKKIKTLRITGNNSFVQVDFSEDNQNQLIDILNCLT